MTEAMIGHNSTAVAKEQLLSVIERIEKMNEEIKALQDDRRDILTEAKGAGYQVNVLKTIVRLRAEDPAKRQEREAIEEIYRTALGMLD